MIATNLPLFFLGISAGATAQMLARRVPQPQQLDSRTVRAQGGWALLAEEFCPNDLAICGSQPYCCPTTLTCQGFGGPTNLCCPDSESCANTYRATPYCADDTWSLWDLSQGGINNSGYFCCAPGLVGLLDSKCADPSTVLSPTLEAMALLPGGAVSTGAISVVVSTKVVSQGTTIGVTSTHTSILTSSETSTATTIVVAEGNSTLNGIISSKTSTSSATRSNTSVSVTTGGTTPGSSTTSSASTTTQKSGANKHMVFGFSSMIFAQFALAILIGISH